MDSNLVYSIFVTFYSNSLITVQVWYETIPNQANIEPYPKKTYHESGTQPLVF